MPKLTLEERRRETLRRQLYGKEESVVSHKPKSANERNNTTPTKTFSMPAYQSSASGSELLDTNYLSKDLTKILIFSALAIGTQLSLYFLLQHNLVKLPF